MDVLNYNREAWDRQVEKKNRWTVPVSTEEINNARECKIKLVLTPTKVVPSQWYPNLKGSQTLCLASGGGQQAPLLAAAGAIVTVLDASEAQLTQDRFVAEREGLPLQTVQGDMADLSMFSDASFDLIFHPCSNCFATSVRPVWKECARLLKQEGILLAGFTNPVRYIFDDERKENGNLEVVHSLPYSDLTHLSQSELQDLVLTPGQPIEHGHTLEDQIGGQLDAGLVLTGFYEDRYEDATNDPISQFMCTFIATRAMKLSSWI